MNTAHKKPKQARARATVEAILQATELMINEDGFEEISTNKIAKRAGVSIGSLYQFFPNKEAIFVALEERLIEQLSLEVGRTMLAHSETSAELLAELILDQVFAAAKDQPQMTRLFSQFISHPGGTKSLLKLQEKIIVLGRQLLLKNKSHVYFEDAHTTSHVLSNMCVLLLANFFAHPQSYVSEEQFRKELLLLISARMNVSKK